MNRGHAGLRDVDTVGESHNDYFCTISPEEAIGHVSCLNLLRNLVTLHCNFEADVRHL